MVQCGYFLVLLPVILASCVVLTDALKPTVSDPVKILKCVEKWKKRDPSIVGRYNDDILKVLCDKPEHWKEQVGKAKKQPNYRKANHTKPQGQYYSSLETPNYSNGGNRGKRQALPKCVRREIRSLSADDLIRLKKCFNTLKNTFVDGVSKYDIIAGIHQPSISPEAHGGHSFHCFHREYLNELETALRQVDPLCCLPYWASNFDQPLRQPQYSVIYDDSLLGTPSGCVTSGLCANWAVPQADTNDCPGGVLNSKPCLCRNLDTANAGQLFYRSDITQEYLSNPLYKDLSYCTNPSIEPLHGGVHVAAGGHMGSVPTSTYDCMFWLHHCYIDYNYQKWYDQHSDAYNHLDVHYPANCDNGCDSASQCDPFDEMSPTGLKNSYGLNPIYPDQYFSYLDPPKCNADKTGCDQPSPYYFCDAPNNRVVSKIKVGGDCSNFKGQDCCYQGTCGSDGKCAATGSTTSNSGGGSVIGPVGGIPVLRSADPAGPSPSTAGPSPSTAHPTPSTAGPTPSTAGPSPSTAHPSPSTAGPSPYPAGPTPSTARPSPYPAGPTPSTARPSPYPAGPTPSTARPSPYPAGPSPAGSNKDSKNKGGNSKNNGHKGGKSKGGAPAPGKYGNGNKGATTTPPPPPPPPPPPRKYCGLFGLLC